MSRLAIFLAASWLAAQTAVAGDCGVAAAGCEQGQCRQEHGNCPKCGGKMICKTVCEVKEIKKTVWNVKCEPFCAPLPGHGRSCGCGDAACGGCEANCDATPACGDGKCGRCKSCCGPCAVEEAKRYVPPKCGPVRTKKTLEKKEVTCKVPSYKCVPVCCQCGCGGGHCGDAGCGDGGRSSSVPVQRTDPVSNPVEPAPVPPPPGRTTHTTMFPPVWKVVYTK